MSIKKKIIFAGILLCAVLITAVGYCLLRNDMMAEPHPEMTTATAAPGTTSRKEEEVICERQIDLNTASAEELMQLPKIGESLANRIVDYREKKPFKVVRDVKKVSGIGDSTFEAIKPYICVN